MVQDQGSFQRRPLTPHCLESSTSGSGTPREPGEESSSEESAATSKEETPPVESTPEVNCVPRCDPHDPKQRSRASTGRRTADSWKGGECEGRATGPAVPPPATQSSGMGPHPFPSSKRRTEVDEDEGKGEKRARRT